MEEAEKITRDFLDLPKLGAYHTTAPKQLPQTAASAQTALLQHSSLK